ncbi:GntR family transcriptional regulator [Clostridium novyi A str. 4552]|uniref:GntR family transcriptional regulator n=1 Tax=Clostridium novyi A str. 4552 TaxID=1444289 RepID=A0A0A0IFS8_CLONO|nr:TrkA C-terminal domain-containing protein [Clostridium novyi]KGM98440.1 GntR family transcriptional regulator [Clostridium novyi A str. 4552]
MGERIETPRYINIAVDVAIRIYKGELVTGNRLSGRSILAGEYNVSPETIRKSMKILEDKKVVEVNKGSGIVVKSPEKAYEFLESFREKEEITILRNKIKDLFQKRKNIDKRIEEVNKKILDYSYRFKDTALVEPIEIEICEDATIVGKTIGESKFWYNTGGTIVCVKRKEKMLVSPGPHLRFSKGDKILVVGDDGLSDRIKFYLYSEAK